MAITRVGQAATKISGTGTGTAITTVLPTGIAAGDVLILEVGTGLGPYTIPDPAGWTLLRRIGDTSSSPSEAALTVWWKVAGSSETAPSLTSPTATRWHSCVRAFRGVDAVSPFLAENAAAETTSTATHTAPTLTNTNAGAWGVAALVSRQVATPYTATAGAGLTERVDQDTGNGSSVNTLYWAGDSGATVATGSVTYSVTGSAASGVAVIWAALLSPASGGLPVTVSGATAAANVSAVDGGAVSGGTGGGVTIAGATATVNVRAGSSALIFGATATVVAQGGQAPAPLQPPSDLWPPDPYRQAIRSGAVAVTWTVDATLGVQPVAGAQGLQPTGGTITDTTKPGVRRVLSLELAPEPGLFDLLSPIGTRLTVTAHVRYTNRQTVDIPMGVFNVDSEKLSEGGGALSLTAPDRWVEIQRARFIGPAASTPGSTVVDQIATLIRGAIGTTADVAITATSTAATPALTWEKDRDKAITDLATSIGAWVFFDRNGIPTIADVPTIGAAADWLIDASPSGVLITLDRERSRTEARNVVVVESSAASGALFPTQWVWDNDPTSPTYAGTNPPGSPETAGPFGVVTEYYDTPILTTADAARAAGMTILARVTGLASQVSLDSVPNPAMDAFDVLDVLPPKERYDIPRVLERHVVDTVTHPLALGQPQHIDGRSTRADAIDGGA